MTAPENVNPPAGLPSSTGEIAPQGAPTLTIEELQRLLVDAEKLQEQLAADFSAGQ
jgi:hypothetical protein